MFGYAIKDTPELMPLPIALAHRLARRLTEVRKSGVLDYLRPDGKTQVTVQYDGNTPVRLDTVVLSTQHADGIDLESGLAPDIREKVVNTVLADLDHESLDTSDYRLLVNPTGKFVLGGPMGDAGHHLGLRPASRRDRPRPRPVAPDLRANRRLRSLRPHRRRSAVGADGQGRGTQGLRLVPPPSSRTSP